MRLLVPAFLLAACAPVEPPPPPPVTVQDCVANPACTKKLVAAHSANPYFGPENSRVAFQASIDQGAHLLETDVRVTQDGVPVMLHDDELSPATSCEGSLRETNFADLAPCDIAVVTGMDPWGYDGTTLPPQQPVALEELYALSGGRALVVAEIKEDPDNAAANLVRDRGWIDRTIFLASADEAARLRALGPEFWILLRTRSAEDADAAIAANDPRIPVFHFDDEWGSPEVLARVHASGRKAWINTFSNPLDGVLELTGEELCSRYFDRGFDLVQTNRTDLCVGALRARGME